ncbi:hypothetical protein [Thiolapillus sp.]|uniref:hypothetical protein n=1 Tax=Thiolapillus sp. TaxID=2017437 RepID=UPI00263ACC8D|nr:hypothetical protein [Thiolapillus sp.]
MTRTAGAQIGCQRPSRFWGLGCSKIYHEAEDTLGRHHPRPQPGHGVLPPRRNCRHREYRPGDLQPHDPRPGKRHYLPA